ncbi:actin-like ATPase domain protein [Fusarium subglutinans]|uniref:Actin-like ATPase domain protein n=1 Tax=Gibberella subglutinans TaxID=42677 RepID=A0A8H5P097_GIBSU|nr:actin-like ATPase domain protein [Fusarium subglutinans]KAF5586101.1 actin-like ATPase domain protein [Fusarium subglutinans]
MSNPSPDLVIGIDFGTTGTAVAYANPTENKVYHVKNWPEGFKNYDKVPSMVAFEGRNLAAWGFGVLNLELESITNLNSYKLFKPLFNSPNRPDATEAKRCVCTFLEALHKHLQQELKGMLPEQTWDESKVKFLFSYPTTWDQETKERFSTAIEEAGYKKWGDQASLLSLDEAEASMLHYLNSASEYTLPKREDYIMVADIGGGTSDVSINKVVDLTGREAKLLPMVCDEGKYIGSTQIDDQFKDKLRLRLMDPYRERLRDKVDVQQLDAVVDSYLDAAVLHLEQSPVYVQQKHTYGQKAVGGKIQKPEFQLLLPDPSTIKEGVTGSAQDVRRGESIHKGEFFENAFSEQCSKIWNQCKLQMEEFEKMDKVDSGQMVKYVVLAGGLGSSAYIMAKLSQEFAVYAKSHKANPPTVIQIRDAEIAVCQGLVHDELRQLHGNPVWVYPAVASYGIEKAGNKNDIKWFLRYGDELKVPHGITIERHVDIAKLKALDLQLVKVTNPPPTGLIIKSADKEAWNQRAVPVRDISKWVKDLLPSDLKGRHRFSKKATLVIKAELSRELITMTLEYDKQQLSEKIFVLESWHKDPKVGKKGKTAPRSKAWKFNMSTSDKIAAGTLGLGIISGILLAVNQFRKKPEPTPVQVTVDDQKSDKKDGQDADKNVESENGISNSSIANDGGGVSGTVN